MVYYIIVQLIVSQRHIDIDVRRILCFCRNFRAVHGSKLVSVLIIFVNHHIVLLRVGMQRIGAEQFVVFVVLISGCLVSDCHLFPVIVGVIGIGNIFPSCFCFSGNTAKHVIGVGCRFFRALSLLIHNGRNFFCFLSVFEIGTAVLGNHTFSRLVCHRG